MSWLELGNVHPLAVEIVLVNVTAINGNTLVSVIGAIVSKNENNISNYKLRLIGRFNRYYKREKNKVQRQNYIHTSRVTRGKKDLRLLSRVIRIFTWVGHQAYIDRPRGRRTLCGLRRLYCRSNRLHRKWRILPSSDNACERKMVVLEINIPFSRQNLF